MKELKKQHLEMLQLLESIEVMLQNGNSIHPNSIIRGAIRISIGMYQYGMPEGLDTAEKHEQYLNDIGLKKQTAVEWLIDEINSIKSSSTNMNGKVQFLEKELNNLFKQAKEMERSQTAVEWLENEFQEICKDFGGLHTDFIERFKQAKEMQDEQMQLTWNNAIDAVQKDKWHSYYEFYNNNFKSE